MQRELARRVSRLALLVALAAPGAAGAGESGTVPSAPDRATAIRQAEIEANARHARAMRECGSAANYAGCVRDADAALHDALRGLAGERQRDATPPGSTAQDTQRVQGGRLIRELEQAAPRPPLRRPTDPGSVTPRP